MTDWFTLGEQAAQDLLTPALLFYSDRIDRNIHQMITIAGDAVRLRPHVKTYKCRELVQRQLEAGICKFKCATLAELEMLMQLQVPDILLAYPLVGPEQDVFRQWSVAYSGRLSVLIDHSSQVEAWQSDPSVPIHCFIDLNVGMNRTGIRPEQAEALRKSLEGTNLIFCGWHAYDGHIHEADLSSRSRAVDQAFAPVQDLLLRSEWDQSLELICGGSISFPVHASYPERTLSPGTTVLWDWGYGQQFADLDYVIAATVACRVVSKPADQTLCLNLGYKAIGAEMEGSPVYFPDFPDARVINHSEEHLLIYTRAATDYEPGRLVYALPTHICPTVALYEHAYLVDNGSLTQKVKIVARKRYDYAQ